MDIGIVGRVAIQLALQAVQMGNRAGHFLLQQRGSRFRIRQNQTAAGIAQNAFNSLKRVCRI
ncbi:hypothetical protein D3C85_1804230 [compost metagenome]